MLGQGLLILIDTDLFQTALVYDFVASTNVNCSKVLPTPEKETSSNHSIAEN